MHLFQQPFMVFKGTWVIVGWSFGDNGSHINRLGAMVHQLGPLAKAHWPPNAPFGACLNRGGQLLGDL